MKKIITFVLSLTVVVLFAGESRAQFTRGSWELTFSAGLNNFSESLNGQSSSSDNITILSLGVSPGYYIIDGLSFEPEIGFQALLSGNSNTTAYHKLVANISYTFYSPGKTFAPYIKAGIGTSNGLDFTSGKFNVAEVVGDNNSAVTILNAGIGIKSLIGKNAAIRTELNYSKESYSYTGSSLSGNNADYSMANIGLVVGVSLIIP